MGSTWEGGMPKNKRDFFNPEPTWKTSYKPPIPPAGVGSSGDYDKEIDVINDELDDLRESMEELRKENQLLAQYIYNNLKEKE